MIDFALIISSYDLIFIAPHGADTTNPSSVSISLLEVQITRSASNRNENSRSSQPYPQTCPFQITKVRHLDFLQNDDSIRYTCKMLIASSRGLEYKE